MKRYGKLRKNGDGSYDASNDDFEIWITFINDKAAKIHYRVFKRELLSHSQLGLLSQVNSRSKKPKNLGYMRHWKTESGEFFAEYRDGGPYNGMHFIICTKEYAQHNLKGL